MPISRFKLATASGAVHRTRDNQRGLLTSPPLVQNQHGSVSESLSAERNFIDFISDAFPPQESCRMLPILAYSLYPSGILRFISVLFNLVDIPTLLHSPLGYLVLHVDQVKYYRKGSIPCKVQNKKETYLQIYINTLKHHYAKLMLGYSKCAVLSQTPASTLGMTFDGFR